MQAEQLTILKDLAGPIATVVAAGAAAFVAYRLGQSQIAVAKLQAAISERAWRTSNEKVVLELMERRIKIFQEIRNVIAEIIQTGTASNDIYFKYVSAIDQVPYLFGPEVEEYLEKLRHHIVDLGLGNSMMTDRASADYQEGVKIKHREFKEVVKFYEEANPLFRPYIRAHQKVD